MGNKIKLGDEVRHKITGLIGIVVAVSTYLFSSSRYAVLPSNLAGGKQPEWVWCDDSELVVTVPSTTEVLAALLAE